MTLAAGGIVRLFTLAHREMEIHREILAFSVSHDDRTVRIYGHYPVLKKGKDTEYYHHQIHTFDFTTLDGKDKWTAYKIISYNYNNWAPSHFKMLCSVIDEVQQSELQVPTESGLSQELESRHISPQSGTDTSSPLGKGNNSSADLTSDTSQSEESGRALKKRKNPCVDKQAKEQAINSHVS